MNETPDFTAYQRQIDAMAALAAELLPVNKTALFDALHAADIKTVVVAFDGFGDSGQIEGVTALNADDAAVDLPREPITWRDAVFDGPAIADKQRTPGDALECLAYDLLSAVHAGWENGDGAYGEFTFDVAARTITLDFNERYTESTHYQHEF